MDFFQVFGVMFKSKVYRHFLVALIAMLTGCGSGSDGLSVSDPSNPLAQDTNSTSQPSSDSQSDPNSVNPYVTGSLFYHVSEDQGASRLDLSTGYDIFVPKSDTWYEEFPRQAGIFSEPLRFDNSEIVLTGMTCKPVETCIVIQNSSGDYVSSFGINYYTEKFAQLSLDKQYVGIVLSGDTGGEFFRIYDRLGSLISSAPVEDNSRFKWLRNGSVIFEHNTRSFTLTKPYDAEADIIISLPDSMTGSITTMDMSPDGNQLAFTLSRYVESESDFQTELNVLNIETGQIRTIVRPTRVAVANKILFPSWSPDGKWIMFRLAPSYGVVGGAKLTLYAVRSDHDGVIPINYYAEHTDSPLLVKLKHYDGSFILDTWTRRDYIWQP